MQRTANPTEKIQNMLAESIWNNPHLQIKNKTFYDPIFAETCLMKMVSSKTGLTSPIKESLVQNISDICR